MVVVAAPATTAASPSGAVHRARHRFAGTLDDRSVTNQQKSFLDQRSRDNRSGAVENSGEGGPRDSHPLGGRFLVQALMVGKA